MMSQIFQSDFGAVSINNLFNSIGMYGNPGDYAWGRDFNDVLNQFFNAGG
jgi:hypothetical protein